MKDKGTKGRKKMLENLHSTNIKLSKVCGVGDIPATNQYL